MATIRALISGQWVEVGGPDEVFIGPNDPGGPYELWYDSDDPGTGDLSKLPRGWVGHAAATGGLTVSQTETDIPGCSVTWTADPTRRYKITLGAPVVTQQTAAGNQKLVIADAANGGYIADWVNTASGNSAQHFVLLVQSGLSGTQTRKARLSCSAGSCVTTANAWECPVILVEDIGGV